jgi:hypothetical protein
MDTPSLSIDGNEYIFVKTRSHMPISIYKGQDCYLRIGPRELIEQEINYHKSLLGFGFPIPTILSEGEYLDSYYFTETSFGDEHLGQIFRTHCAGGVVSDTDFSKLLNVVKIFTLAQIKTVGTQSFVPDTFKELLLVDTLINELPKLEQLTREAMAHIDDRVIKLPSVLTHGDFNPYNIFEKGVIDWERGSYVPIGYDLATNISQAFFFPRGGDYEFTRGYYYSENQTDTYWREIDALAESAHIPPLSDFRNDFILCRSIWSVVHMDRWPKIQAWRNSQYEALLAEYLAGGDLTKFLLEYEA